MSSSLVYHHIIIVIILSWSLSPSSPSPLWPSSRSSSSSSQPSSTFRQNHNQTPAEALDMQIMFTIIIIITIIRIKLHLKQKTPKLCLISSSPTSLAFHYFDQITIKLQLKQYTYRLCLQSLFAYHHCDQNPNQTSDETLKKQLLFTSIIIITIIVSTPSLWLKSQSNSSKSTKHGNCVYNHH